MAARVIGQSSSQRCGPSFMGVPSGNPAHTADQAQRRCKERPPVSFTVASAGKEGKPTGPCGGGRNGAHGQIVYMY